MPKFKNLKSRTLFKANRWDVQEATYDQHGQHKTFDYITEASDSVVTVAITKHREVILIREYRLPIKHYNIELPGGSSDNEPLLIAAKRELSEETGITAKTWSKLGALRPFPAVSSETKHVFLAQELDLSHFKPQNDEDISRVMFVALKDISKYIVLGKITDSQTIACLTLTKLKLGYKK